MKEKIKKLAFKHERRKKELAERIELCREYRRKIILLTNILRDKYNRRLIGETEYRHQLYSQLNGKEPEDWVKYYDGHIEFCNNKIKEIDGIKDEADAGFRNLAVVAMVILFMFIGIFFGKYMQTGFTVLNDADVFASQETYDVGDMAHISITPPGIGYEIEVYGPDNELYAVSLDFPLEKIGTYTIKAVLTDGNETKKLQSQFGVVEGKEIGEVTAGPATNATENATLEGITSGAVQNETIHETPNETENITSSNPTITQLQQNNTDISVNKTKGQGLAETPSPSINAPSGNNTGKDIRLKKIDVQFSQSDIKESYEADEEDKPVIVSTLDKEDVKIKVRGAGKDSIKNAQFKDGILHVDSTVIKDATINLPHEPLSGIMSSPLLYIKEDNESVFRLAQPYTKDGRTFNKIRVDKDYYEFDVEHFTSYYVNSSGGDYATLTTCLNAVNTTANDCVINGEGSWSIDGPFKYNLTGDGITIAIGNVSLDCNNSIIYGDGTTGDYGLYHYRAGGNITIKNCDFELFGKNYYLDGNGTSSPSIQTENITLINCKSVEGYEGFSLQFDYGNFTMSNFTAINENAIAFRGSQYNYIAGFDAINSTHFYIIGDNYSTYDKINVTANNESTMAVNMTDDFNTTLRNSYIWAGKLTAISLNNSQNSTILNNTIKTNITSGHGIFLQRNSSYNLVQNNSVTATASSAYGIYTATNSISNVIYNNRVTSSAASGIGIYLTSISNVAANNTLPSVASRTGIRSDSILNTMTNNTVTATSGIAMQLNGNSNTLNNNIVTLTTGNGIYLNYANLTTISNNTVTATTGIGIYMVSAPFNNLSGNMVNTTQGNSYWIYGLNAVSLNNTISPDNLAEGRPVNFTWNASSLVIDSVNYTSYGQVIFAACTNITITNSNFSWDSLNLFLTNLSDINNNIINTSKGYGIFLYSRSNLNNITRNMINTSLTNGFGIYLNTNPSSNTIDNNSIRTYGSTSYGIYLLTTAVGNTISNNTIISSGASGHGIYINAANYNFILNNSISASSTTSYGIYLQAHSSSFLDDVRINTSNTGYGIVLQGTLTNITMSRMNVKTATSAANAVYIVSGLVNFTLTDSILNASHASATDFFVANATTNGIWNFTNVSFTDKQWDNITNSGTLNVKWYLDAYAEYTHNQPAANVNITAWDVNNTAAFSTLTLADGRIARQILSDYKQNGSNTTLNITYFSNYTFNASLPSYTTQTQSWNISSNMALNFTIDLPPTIASVLLNSTSPDNLTVDNLTAYPSGAADPDGDNIDLNYNWYRNGASDTVLNMPMTAPDSLNRTYDFSGDNFHGNVTNTSTWSRTGGYNGFGAYMFDGVDDYINVTAGSINMTAISLWLKNATAWYFVANSSGTVYVDGVVSANILIPVINDSNSVIIGMTSSSTYFNGTIDDVRIWNRTLSANEIKLLYENKTNITHADATSVGDNWTVKVTPIDQYGLNGTPVFSNSLNITQMLLNFVNQTISSTGRLVNDTYPMGIDQNLTINVNATAIGGGLDSVWLIVWQTVKSAANILWQGLMSIVGAFYQVNVTVNQSYPEGVVNYTIYANFTGGNITQIEGNFSIDSINPSVGYGGSTEADGSYKSQDWIYINVSVDEANFNNITFRLYNSTELLNETNFTTQVYSVNFTNLAYSTYWYNVTVADITGNTNSTPTRSITLSITAPNITSISPLNRSGDSDGNITFSYNVTGIAPILNCSLLLDNQVNKTNTSIARNTTLTFSLNNMAAGNYAWSVNCSDSAYNSGWSEQRKLTVVLASQYTTTDLSLINVGDITQFSVENPAYGKINFSEIANLSVGMNINSNVNISFNRIELNSTSLPQLNKSATLSLYNLTFNDPRILMDGSVCSSSVCTEISYSGGTLVFNVTHFTAYSAEETPSAAEVSAVKAAGGRGAGGAATSAATMGCEEDSDCSEDNACLNNLCVKLFDVKIVTADFIIEPGEHLDFVYAIKGMANISGDVIMSFWLEIDNRTFASGSDTIYVSSFEQKVEKANIFLPLSTPVGLYNLNVQVAYGNYSARSHRSVQVRMNAPLLLEINLLDMPSFTSDNIFNFSPVLSFNKDAPTQLYLEEKITSGSDIVWKKGRDVTVNRSLMLSEKAIRLNPGAYQLEIIGRYDNKTARLVQSFVIERPLLIRYPSARGRTTIYAFAAVILAVVLAIIAYLFLMKRRKKGQLGGGIISGTGSKTPENMPLPSIEQPPEGAKSGEAPGYADRIDYEQKMNLLNGRIMLCEYYKKKITLLLDQTRHHYFRGLINREEHDKRVYGEADMRGFKDWIRYYDSYIRLCRDEMARIEKEKLKK